MQTWQSFIYLVTVVDCYSKKVVGWSIADHMRVELVWDVLKNAAATKLIHPTDPSARLGRVGACGDNAAMESFYSLLQKMFSIDNGGQPERNYV